MTPVTPADSEAEALALALLGDAARIVTAIRGLGLSLEEPRTILAVQLLGAMLARVLGGDPRRTAEAVAGIAERVDLERTKELLKG